MCGHGITGAAFSFIGFSDAGKGKEEAL